ncbi:uncharacterized protein LOC127872545 [Dreissena polymorpha]|uniref:uncharacterized protein LOC127872545 n=1 Tax=Dreissena polymorpha TaxID=45954 RepID=UPI0022647865|nr:uncharacterized protein LOC127872545 [Dreissena polymorpha]
MTIHKSQGLTLNRLEVDCHQIFKPGQLGVALGRAKSSEGLRVINFDPTCHVISQPEVVQLFMNQPSILEHEDLSCCRPGLKGNTQEPNPPGIYTLQDMQLIQESIDNVEMNENVTSQEEFDSEFDELILKISSVKDDLNLPDDLNLDQILDQIYFKNPVTAMQDHVNRIINDMNKIKYIQFCKKEYAFYSALIESSNTEPIRPFTAKQQTEFYSNVHAHQTSAEFRMNCLTLFEDSRFTDDHVHICFNVSNQIRKYVLQSNVERLPVVQRHISNRSVTNESHARVRYIGSYCIAKILHKNKQKKKNNMYNLDSASISKYNDSLKLVNVLESLKVEEQYIQSITKEPESLIDIACKQYGQRLLTNISDELAIDRDCVSLDAKVTALNRECRPTLLLRHNIREQHMEVSHVNRRVTQRLLYLWIRLFHLERLIGTGVELTKAQLLEVLM